MHKRPLIYEKRNKSKRMRRHLDLFYPSPLLRLLFCASALFNFEEDRK
jgi:hypothetical protein